MNQSQMLLKVATDFSRTPGPRYPSEGSFSGEEFRKNVLLPMYKKARAQDEVLVVDLDGTAGFGTSFIEEAFGGLIRDDGITLSELKKWLKIVSDEEPHLLEEANAYMQEAEENRES